MHPLAQLDHRYLWHPFTQMRDWLKREPILIVRGRGARVRDARGREYLDANASIWTNLHGHHHPRINAAIRRQLDRIAHSSALGLANAPAARLGEQLVQAANPPRRGPAARLLRQPVLGKVFFSDNGSTAMEVALKLAYEFTRRSGRDARPRFLTLDGAYHGDTVGAVSLGHIDLFHKAYSGLLFPTDKVPAPYCYRCAFNRARPERADARDYRQCRWECLDALERKFAAQARRGNPYAAFVFEPLMQGAAGMIPQPAGWLRRAAAIARAHGALLIADEVMTGFGRTAPRESGLSGAAQPRRKTGPAETPDLPLFACHHEGVRPDFMALAKGLSGGYLPMAATLTTQAVFDAFLGEYEEFKTFFHGHSFTANQLGAAAGLASLAILRSTASIRARIRLAQTLRAGLETLWRSPHAGDIRQVGLIAGIELVRDWRTRAPFDLRERVGIRVCETLARLGVLTRPIGNVIVLMPPYCTTPAEARRIIAALGQALDDLRQSL
ncbi:MAG TPA: aminotransferase class III-fold pyridoxal phosphate-dependent enzyme [Verrucomicrobiota bacterium]|nr:aminotransferase class III-fold pyridoxal phosphate-dependent enzyme [Verrucomicrobiota bacterium]OQC26584.1 MAG: L-Lysine-8-amino-7-oxononanoate aminotransferase [Verrucomicrobia bacterium ADurb.Bin063]HRR63819.1 aminotransferase class III-fold pyridoxal phosphate-dependent enzyme [Candidatus Paceibacterota bacterium]MBP8014494.1 aminotransferase class III-fold pyridoxal phosphate-dependent enzyme [Verrucomicrobiota bacterium]MDI9373795.1 aminotransferase class III-fold pyridoxal phosphate-